MSNLNMLIARGGGYQPPQDITTSKLKALGIRRNQIAAQREEAELQNMPENQEFRRQAMQLRGKEFQLSEDAFKLKKQLAEMPPTSKDITMDLSPEVSISGPREVIAETLDVVYQDPTWLTDEKKLYKTLGWLAANGVSFNQKAQGGQGFKVGSTRTIQRGGQNVTEEFDGTSWKEIGSGPRFKPDTPKQPDPGDVSEREKFLSSEQTKAKSTIFKLYGASEFEALDPRIANKVGDAIETAAQMLEDNPKLSAQQAATRAKKAVDMQYKILESIPRKPKGLFADNVDSQTLSVIKTALTNNVDTADILRRLAEAGWSKDEAIALIKKAHFEKTNQGQGESLVGSQRKP